MLFDEFIISESDLDESYEDFSYKEKRKWYRKFKVYKKEKKKYKYKCWKLLKNIDSDSDLRKKEKRSER